MKKDILQALVGIALMLVCGVPMFATPAVAQSAKAYDAIVAKDGLARAEDFRDALRVNVRPEMHAELAPIIAAIRYAENGGKGREYGILHKRVKPTYRSQAGWCAATVQKNWDRWVKAGRKGEFLVYLGKKYCPVGAENDPNGLNKHWLKNVRYHTQKIKGAK